MARDMDSQEWPDPSRERPVPSVPPRDPEPLSHERQPVRGRGFAYLLSDSERKTLQDIGRFRTVDARDLAEFRYPKDADHMREELRSLREQGLITRRTIWTGKQERLTVYVLTKRGKALLERGAGPRHGQRIFAGFVKPAEVRHDAAIYRMYQVEAGNIERSGGKVRRVVLDYELKQTVYRPLAKARAEAGPHLSEYVQRQSEIARQNSLKVVGGKILLPDLRVEYETDSGELAHVDLELATRHYRGFSLRAKAQAGFKMYAPKNSNPGRGAANDPELMAEIISF